MRRIAIVGVIALAAASASAQVSTWQVRCADGIVRAGDTRVYVHDACGEPTEQTSSIELRRIGRYGRRQVHLDRWQYARLGDRPECVIVFEEGQLVQIVLAPDR